jgi:GNAT superfamily N-acetyltransferase
MIVVVYKREHLSVGTALGGPSADHHLVEWTPSLLRIVPKNIAFERLGFLKNWLFHSPRFFFMRDRIYRVYALVRDGEVLCQCIVTPASARYPFMGPDDLQFGLVFTSPAHRNKRLASTMVRAIVERLGAERTYWWLTEETNSSSRAVVERLGFSLVGRAERRSVLGFSYYDLLPEAQGRQ